VIRFGAVLLVFLDDLRLLLARHFFVVAELFQMHTASAGQRPQYAGVAVKFLGRHVRFDDLKTSIRVHALNPAAPARQIAHHFAHAIFGNTNLDVVNRLQQTRSHGGEGFLKRKVSGALKRDVVPIAPALLIWNNSPADFAEPETGREDMDKKFSTPEPTNLLVAQS
jgi:hypothetical protein